MPILDRLKGLIAVRPAISALVIVSTALFFSGSHGAAARAPAAEHVLGANQVVDDRPNIVFITTDDQRADDMRWMPYTRKLLGGRGVTFTRGLSPHPLCCPARAEFVSGQYAQNNGVIYNNGDHGGYPAFKNPSNNIGQWLHDAGYLTAMVGKYMNHYVPDDQEGEWDHWNPSTEGEYSYDNTTFHNDGNSILHTRHVDDVITGYATDYIEEFAAADRPYFIWASNLAPHGKSSPPQPPRPPQPAARHRGMFPDITNPAVNKPSYNIPLEGYPVRKPLVDRQDRFQARIESLQAVDEGVREIMRTLRRTGELANSYIIFTSDNGYMMGEHSLGSKNYLLTEALRVPFLVRVPGHTTATRSAVPVTSVDIAPTVVDLAGATPGRVLDGTSFAPLLVSGAQQWRDTQLVQTGSDAPDSPDGFEMRGVYTGRWNYGKNTLTGAEQLFDRRMDPFEMKNLATRPRYAPIVAELRHRTEVLKTCAGAVCNRDFGPVPAKLPKSPSQDFVVDGH